MDAELEIRRLQRRVQELEQENAELRAQLAAFGLSSSAQGKAGDTVLSAAQMPSNTAATLDAPAPNTVTPSHNRQSIPPAQSAPLSVARTSSPAEKIRLFRSLFRGRTDVYALRWHSEKAQKSGYSPVCANEWRPGLCEKGRVPCAKCPNRVLRPLDDAAIYRHLAGRDAQGRDVVGLYPMLSDETCYLLALDFDDANWQDCARAIADVCRAHSIPFALERSRSGQGAHVWLFFAEAIPCAKARRLGDALLTAAMDTCGGISFTAYDRMFPNQDTLPAGGFGNLIALPLQGQARRQGNSIFLNDSLTPYPDPWAFLSTVRTLRPDQQPAVDALLAHRNGVLSATTAFGKTVVAAWLIAQRGVNTLILVHTQALLNQWQAALSQFLQIDEQLPPQPKRRGRQRKRCLIGQIGGGKHTAAGFVDIAMLQSLVHGGEIDPRVREYGVVIVDECHHVSAAGFEQVLRAVPARYVYGLTATPARADGHGPIITMQCGPIRYQVSAKEQAERQGFARVVVPRFTRFALPLTTEKATYGKICEALARDMLRNDRIVHDACDLLAQGRTPLLLTERLDHAKTLAAALRPCCPHVFLLSGRGTAKEKRALLDALAAVPVGQPLAVVAIGKYAGEGFDLPRLDALLLTMPVVWKGTLTQYTGRLHRAAPGKREVLLYDYVDLRVPMLEQQYRRRLRSYAALAYTVRGTAEKPESSEQTAQREAAVFVSCEQFPQRFAADLEGATREVLLCVPSLSARSVQRMLPLLQRLQHKGGDVQVYLPEPAQFRPDIQPKITASAAALQRAGIPVMFCPDRLPNFCILDQRLVWYGGLNPLGRMPDGESCLRMDAPDVAAELMEFLRGIMPSG